MEYTIRQETLDLLLTTQIQQGTPNSLLTTQIQQGTPDSLRNTQFGSERFHFWLWTTQLHLARFF
jgi:hypothetical protein